MTNTHQFRQHRLEEMIELYNHLVALADLTGSQKVNDSAWQIRRMIKDEVRQIANRQIVGSFAGRRNALTGLRGSAPAPHG